MWTYTDLRISLGFWIISSGTEKIHIVKKERRELWEVERSLYHSIVNTWLILPSHSIFVVEFKLEDKVVKDLLNQSSETNNRCLCRIMELTNNDSIFSNLRELRSLSISCSKGYSSFDGPRPKDIDINRPKKSHGVNLLSLVKWIKTESRVQNLRSHFLRIWNRFEKWTP